MLNRFFACAFVALAACMSPSPTGISNLSCPTSSTLTYTSFGSGFVTNHCLSCHANNDRPTLSTQAEVKANAAKILDAAVYTNAMPKDADMPLADRQLLGEWLACGAP
jgi:uncharacterized membrane protein